VRSKERKLNRSFFSPLALCALLFAQCTSAHAQQPGKIFRIGFLDPTNASGMAVMLDAFRQALSKLGWIEEKNIAYEYRFAENKPERVAELAAELVRLKVDLIVTIGDGPTLAAKKATTIIPIVMTTSSDPVAQGLVANLARPGGNVTGLSSLGADLNTKRLEILKDAIPKLARVALLQSLGSVTADLQLKELRPAAVALKLKLEEIDTQPDAKGLESAFKTAKQKQVNAIMTVATRTFSQKESGSSSWLGSIGCRLFTFRRSLSTTGVSCPTGWTTKISSAVPRTM